MEHSNLIPYIDKLYAAALKKAGDSYVAEELVQETLLAAISSFSKGVQPNHLWGWLKRILSNKYCDYLRRQYNDPIISIEAYPYEIAEEDMDDGTMEEYETIRRELGYLAKIHRDVMVRFYMHGDTIAKIAHDLALPPGTVKSRLSTGRKHIRKGIEKMESYTKQSYEPDILNLYCSGEMGRHGEPGALVAKDDRLAQNILLLAYQKPLAETELAKALGVPAAYIEPIIDRLIRGELMQRTNDKKVYTDFVIYDFKYRQSRLHEQLEVATDSFDCFWRSCEAALNELRQRDYYQRQPMHARKKLELHFVIKLLLKGRTQLLSEKAQSMSFYNYPYRKDGGRWLAIGDQYPADFSPQENAEFYRCGLSGEQTQTIAHFRDARNLSLGKYDTHLGSFPDIFHEQEYIKWLYEILMEIPFEQSDTGTYVLQAAEELITHGILLREKGLRLDIPVLKKSEYEDESMLAAFYKKQLAKESRRALQPLWDNGLLELPPHLKNVPKWMQYAHCTECVPMAVINHAIGQKIFLADVNYALPAAILVYES